ncbi:Fanconi anemia group M protein [Orchesella cincta]|uniref:Fanconi anemia group M protein n=1 Tax=Orchesella cincta TaxID=48709 RepID=A0A1D2MAC2_ORCCI|nr:Fanconi anemia group M protein [Orchesella cincta]
MNNALRDVRRGRGRGSTRGTSSRGAGGPRQKWRGRGRAFSPKPSQVFFVDESDDLCNLAFEQFELQNNSLSKSFEEINAAKELAGFDPSLGSIWIYPTNRPVRDYQFNIVQTALFHNTLVCLPTGLGKTFISAVVMYNFQRWYPRGLTVFMAPTRPLVTQQLDACHNTVGISPSKTIELTGHIAPIKRAKLWQEKTVFFLTPQVLLSDLERGHCRAEDIRLIVVDEAHKATGNHAYAQVISKVSATNPLFRVLALSATPGSDLAAVKQVFKNLLISRIELRTETSLDVLPYIHDKAIEKRVVNLDKSYLKSVYEQVVTVFQTYSGKLLKEGALTGRDGYSYTPYQLLTARDTFRKGMALKIPTFKKGFIENDFAICMSLAHAMGILLSHGLRTFFIYLQGVLNKEKGSPAVTAELKKNTKLQTLLNEIKDKLNISVANSTFEMDLGDKDGIFDEVSFSESRRNMGKDIDYTLSHPKLSILKDIVYQHFLAYAIKNDSTRVMIFSQYRDSVQEIGNMLNSLRPMVKPIVFVGQSSTGTTGKGLKQREQVQVVQRFREGGFNVLVSTCVGEEGLDIGEVDLIVCFDASSSPTRLMQRMGRTGANGRGQLYFYSQKERRKSFTQQSSISKSITDPQKLKPYLYKISPRMVPLGIEPTCFKMSILLSTEMSTRPEVVLPFDEDDEEFIDQNKEKVIEKPPVKKRKLKEAPSHTVTKEGDSHHQKLSETAVATEPISEMAEADYDQRAFDYGDEMSIYLASQPHAYQKESIFSSIFDMEPKPRSEWKECASWAKKTTVVLDDLMKNVSVGPESIILTENELADIELNLEVRKSFSANTSDYCACGNLMEQHSHIVRSSTPVNQLEQNPNKPELNIQKQVQAAQVGSLRKDSPHSSDGSAIFLPSPDSNKSGFLRRLLDQKTSTVVEPQPKIQKDRGFLNDISTKVLKPSVPSRPTSLQQSNIKKTVEEAIASVSKPPKKFIFKKKSPQPVSVALNYEKYVQPPIQEEETIETDFDSLSVAPPAFGTIQGISPIRRVAPEVPQDIFKSPHVPTAPKASRLTSLSTSTSNVSLALKPKGPSSKGRLSFVDESPPKSRRKKNPFIDNEAEESGNSSRDDDEFEDAFDASFVSLDESFGVTDTQQFRYLESVKDSIPAKFGRVETPLSPETSGVMDDRSGESFYEQDSICQDEVEYVDVGVFTQAMNAAQVDLMLNGTSEGLQTRRAKRAALNAAAIQVSSKQRRRVIMLDDSTDSGDDDFQ